MIEAHWLFSIHISFPFLDCQQITSFLIACSGPFWAAVALMHSVTLCNLVVSQETEDHHRSPMVKAKIVQLDNKAAGCPPSAPSLALHLTLIILRAIVLASLHVKIVDVSS